ncbi:efflux RND transporter periplasmic adaptor subunit [Krasilnikovia sp. MM14-A1259]|uniref:efflux RND transporter periplasmic adaptor subunit n=1 Tax=Krasilnikovia sp. MM14-A1259 TaxID=3373539 RepID=UPI0037F84E6E
MGEVRAGLRRRRWWVVGAVAGAALLGAGAVHALGASADEKPAAAATVAVDRGAVSTEVATQGTVQPSETRSLSFATDGTVTSVPVRPGSTVTAGQVLAKLDAADATAAVDAARTALQDARTQLDQARTDAARSSAAPAPAGCVVPAVYHEPSVEPPSPAPAVTPGAATPGATSPSPSATPGPPSPTTSGPSGPPTSHPAGGATAPRTPSARRGQPSAQSPASGRGSTAGGCGSATTGGGTSRGTTTGGGNPAGGQRGGGGGQTGGADPILSAEQRVNAAITTLANAEDALAGTTITAPIAGRILTVTGSVGSNVASGSTFITLADVYDMQVTAAFPEADASRVTVRQPAVITLADRPGTTFKATVVQVDPTGTSDGTMVRYRVLLAFDTAPGNLLVGQSAGVTVTTGAERDVLRVPSTAVHDVAGSNGTVLRGGVRTTVGIGLRGDRFTQITSGLSAGEVVVRSW